MKLLILFLFPTLVFASSLPPTPFPVFLKEGFSSIIEFEDSPSKVVLGDTQSFQIERLGKSIAVKPLVPYAVTNMFIYFSDAPPKLLVLTASEEAEPTFYKKFESPPKPPVVERVIPQRTDSSSRKEVRVTLAKLDHKSDYLTVELNLIAGSISLKPVWEKVVLKYGNTTIAPFKLWAERKEVQRDSSIKARFIFAKPNVPRTLKDTYIIVPIAGTLRPFSVLLGRKGQ